MLAFDDAPVVTLSARVAAHRATSAAARAEAIEQLGALLCAAQAELVDVITVVHEGGWAITGTADRELAFTSPYGRTLRSRPQPLSPQARERVGDAIGIPLSEEPPSRPRAGPAP